MQQISRKRFEVEAWYQLPTNRKWPMVERKMTSSMTSYDPERSRSWPQYLEGQLFRKRLEIEPWLQWGTYRKWHVLYRMLTWSMTSHETEMSKSWPSYIYMQISRKWFDIEAGNNYPLIVNGRWQNEGWRRPWRHVTLKGQGRDPNIFTVRYLKTARDRDSVTTGTYTK